jgi:hypothetical protein
MSEIKPQLSTRFEDPPWWFEGGRQGPTFVFSETGAVAVQSGCVGATPPIPSRGLGPTLVRTTWLAGGAADRVTCGPGCLPHLGGGMREVPPGEELNPYRPARASQ